MNRFTVRIELRGSEPMDYEPLHAAMKKAGFKRTITKSGQILKLPRGEYILSREGLAIGDVMKKACGAADHVSDDYGVLVTGPGQFKSHGLESAES
ncbi:MAG: hypothetical protein UT86_C0001G0247 [Candidatus Magasanikbacteria bacterium GW2011_GWC2_40_17]|uniref:Uncharacterized protein n=1 Tax=Candidatus Magasanikbacteria bacterium GW2011_GWA2_42_32 TaxID=1619039 RepID=A0A0G1A9B4_9BACT|nr:MAG: hypothetical protein UT86_C0001G0247 [Candidatus Magasanikbacteria bacterium GW2011_GWC2_40_17]KKS57607.1 MAG: hypothetical protein UV20_C0001G0247 [Candidatus Magasanikbacteria bacterium GW2011_GWA2_42_32]